MPHENILFFSELLQIDFQIEDLAAFGIDSGLTEFGFFILLVLGVKGDAPHGGAKRAFVRFTQGEVDTGDFDVGQSGGAGEGGEDVLGVEFDAGRVDDFLLFVCEDAEFVELGVTLADLGDDIAGDFDFGSILIGKGIKKEDFPFERINADGPFFSMNLDQSFFGGIIDFALGQIPSSEGGESVTVRKSGCEKKKGKQG